MPTTGLEDRLHVVVGVLTNSDGQHFIQQRQASKPCAGYWEFPGGKVESGESAEVALKRELLEELNIIVKETAPLIEFAVDYDHANVFLQVFLVQQFDGIPQSNEAQLFVWKSKQEIAIMRVLKAVHPILDVL